MPPPKESESDPAEAKSFQLNLVNLKWYHCAHRSISTPCLSPIWPRPVS